MILIIDNYDSFTYNLAQYVGSVRPSGSTEVVDKDSHSESSPKTQLEVLRNDDPKLYETAEKADALIFSPGPGWPADAGKMEAMIADFAGKKPMLGICLGFQAMVEVFGGKLRLAHQVMHGKRSTCHQYNDSIAHNKAENVIFAGLPEDFEIMRYHSIVMDENSHPEGFHVTAITTDDGEIMAIEDPTRHIYGLQFHPESIGTPDGMQMVENFVRSIQ
ncbi:MAG: aminodeoxychorismate/anthranilate synthase component II [Streptococcaceae bacterium]|jgi:anthranilate synthase component 2|nr:aminodeoxychorismate/anthranilate synthase component II [Streptococcaceae bacterium]